MYRALARRAVCIAAIATMALAFPCWRVKAQDSAPTEYQLKAAFLFNFAKFIDWPASSFASAQAPFAICILGEDPFGAAIDDTLRGGTIEGRAVTVERIHDASQLRSCQVAFISASEKDHMRELLQSVRGANVLLVGETTGFAAAGGAIQFQLQDNHIRFSINPDAAERAGLCVSSKLLSLATIVHDSAGKGKGCNS
jgi:YfiR/HmsC-like